MFHAMQELDAVLPLALFLAHERNKGQGSFWQPYLGLLPEQPGCAWLMHPEELTQGLQQVKQLVGESLLGRATLMLLHFLLLHEQRKDDCLNRGC